jgi:hypothetical protein
MKILLSSKKKKFYSFVYYFVKGFPLPLHYTTGLKGDLGITLMSLFLKYGADINQRDKVNFFFFLK